MATIDKHEPHSINWVDLAAVNHDAAVEFYSGLFGWTAFNDGETPYSVFQVGDRAVAGVMELTPEMGEMPPVWSTYVNVRDADATVAAVGDAGGTVMQPPFEIPGGGRIAVIADPSGAVICLFENEDGDGMKAMDEPGAPCWFDCMTRDTEAAGAFYTTVFGWTAQPIPEMGYTMFLREGEPTCGMMAMPDMVPAEVPSHWVVNFSVIDCDAAVAYATEHGGMVTMPAMDTPFGRAAGLVDPWGAVMNVIDRSKADAENQPEA